MENQNIPKIVLKKQIISAVSLILLFVFIAVSDNFLTSVFKINDDVISIINIGVIMLWVVFLRTYYRCPKCGARTGMKKGNIFPSSCHKCGVSFRNND